jgi:hypothetical protein
VSAPGATSKPGAMSKPGAGAGVGAAGRGGTDEPPPFWSRWSRIYWFIAGLLAAQIIAFWLLSWWTA